MKQLLSAYRRRRDGGLVSGRRGKPSNNRLDQGVVGRIEWALWQRYADFGPTLAAEKLFEHEGIEVSAETVSVLPASTLKRPLAKLGKEDGLPDLPDLQLVALYRRKNTGRAAQEALAHAIIDALNR